MLLEHSYTYLFTYLSLAAFALKQLCWVVTVEMKIWCSHCFALLLRALQIGSDSYNLILPLDPKSLKYLWFGPLQKKFATLDLSYKLLCVWLNFSFQFKGPSYWPSIYCLPQYLFGPIWTGIKTETLLFFTFNNPVFSLSAFNETKFIEEFRILFLKAKIIYYCNIIRNKYFTTVCHNSMCL